MKNLKWFTILLLIVANVVVAIAENKIADVPPHDLAYSYIKAVVDKKILLTDKDGYFRPKAILTRQQLASIICRVKNLPYKSCIEESLDRGYLSLFTDGQFHPEYQVTRAQAITALVKAENASSLPGERTGYPDVDHDHWSKGAVARAVRLGLIPRGSGQNLAVNEPITRQEMAVMLARMPAFRDVPADGWVETRRIFSRRELESAYNALKRNRTKLTAQITALRAATSRLKTENEKLAIINSGLVGGNKRLIRKIELLEVQDNKNTALSEHIKAELTELKQELAQERTQKEALFKRKQELLQEIEKLRMASITPPPEPLTADLKTPLAPHKTIDNNGQEVNITLNPDPLYAGEVLEIKVSGVQQLTDSARVAVRFSLVEKSVFLKRQASGIYIGKLVLPPELPGGVQEGIFDIVLDGEVLFRRAVAVNIMSWWRE